jgi:phage terminase Nu1 subunit (DNA packaging protein)
MTAVQERLAKKQKVDAGLTIARTELAQMRCHREAMAIAERRGELITKKLVEQQAAYLLVALRQAILNVPQTYARRIVGLKDAKAAKAMLHEMAISLLNDLKDLPSKVTDPNWLEEFAQEKDSSRAVETSD